MESLLLSLQREQVFTCTWVSWNKLELQTARGFPHLISQLAPGSKDSQTWTSQHLTCITLLIWPDSRFSIAFILVKPHKIVLRTISYITANTTDLGFVNSELKVAWGYPTLETEAAVIWCSARKQHCSRKRKRLHCWWCVAWGWRRTNLVSYRIKVPPDWSLVSVWERVFMRCRKCWPY